MLFFVPTGTDLAVQLFKVSLAGGEWIRSRLARDAGYHLRMGLVGKKKDWKYSLVCTTHLSLLCFLSLSFGERKAVVGIVDDLDEKGYDASCHVSMVQETVVEGGQFQIDVLTSWAEMEDLEDLAKQKANKGAWWMARCGGMYWYSAMGLAYWCCYCWLPLFLTVISKKLTFLDSFLFGMFVLQ